jgi:uncharacterized protein (TIGR02300 family)
MEEIEKGAKRKCTQCSTLFFDFGKSPIVCPNCGADVNSLLTNVSKRGRPPKAVKVQKAPQDSEIEIEEIEVQENIEDHVNDDDSVEDMIEIDRKEE